MNEQLGKPTEYIAANSDGTFDAFVGGKGFTANRTLNSALRWIREQTGRTSGPVPCFDRTDRDWTSEYDLTEGV